MIRTEISLFLKNVHGELAKLTALMSDSEINIDAITIQDASNYVKNLFEARGKSIKRFASYASYNAVNKDSAQFSLIRLLVDKPDKAVLLLKEGGYIYDTVDVITVEIENYPGIMAEIVDKFGKAEININYIYGSVAPGDSKCLFVICPEDLELAKDLFS